MEYIDRGSLSLDRDRVTCILLINTYLMKKCLNMYSNVITNQQMMQQMSQEQKTSITYSYGHCIKRLQCNLSTLNYIHEKYHSPNFNPQGHKQAFPMMLSAPPDMPELNQLYLKLQELYADGVQILKQRIEEMRKQQMYNNQQMPQQIPQQIPQQMPQQGMTPQNMTPQQPNMGIPQNIPPQSMPQMVQPQPQMDEMFVNDNYQNESQGYQPYNNMQGYNGHDNGNGMNMSTLSPQQILQQANESKNTPTMTHMDFGLF